MKYTEPLHFQADRGKLTFALSDKLTSIPRSQHTPHYLCNGINKGKEICFHKDNKAQFCRVQACLHACTLRKMHTCLPQTMLLLYFRVGHLNCESAAVWLHKGAVHSKPFIHSFFHPLYPIHHSQPNIRKRIFHNHCAKLFSMRTSQLTCRHIYLYIYIYIQYMLKML